MARVAFLTRVLTHYRVPFHEAVRAALVRHGVEYDLYVGEPTPLESLKGDMGQIAWAKDAPTKYIGNGGLVWQKFKPNATPDLVIIGQEGKILSNYPILMSRILGRRVAYFGHGKNFQSTRPNGLEERFKRLLLSHVDWWFAYTDRTAEIVAKSGFPRSKITVFNNSIDIASIESELNSISVEERERVRRSQFGNSKYIGVYIGGLYREKRVAFLIEAAIKVRQLVPEFRLIVIGGGMELPFVEAAATQYDWIHPVGPKFGRDKSLLISLGKVMLMPGLVGLGVLDSFAYGIPMVTTAIGYHSPEVDYLKDGFNGVIVPQENSTTEYSSAVSRVLVDDPWRRRLEAGARASRSTYSVEEMARRFAEGVVRAISN